MTAVRWGTPALGAVLITACALRVIGLQYGLPAVYNPDEVAIMARALSFAKGTLNPENFLYPTFYFYVLFAWVGLYLGLVWISGGVESLAALRAMYFTAPTGIYTAGRMLGVAAGTATVLALYRLAARIAGERAAIASAVFLAVAPLHVRDSHYVKHDVPATLAIVLAHIAMVRVWPAAAPSGPGRRDVLLAAAACGMAFSTHYYCVFLAVPLALVVARAFAAQGARAIVKHLALAAGVSAAVFLALSPFIAVEPATAWRDIVANREIVVDRGLSAGAFTPAFRYADLLWRDALGIPVLVAGLAGALWMLVAAPGRAVLLLSFPVPFLLFIVNTSPASRYLNPVLPFLALFAGWTLARLFGGLGRAAVFWVAVAVLSAPALVNSIRTGLFFRQDDTRTLAQRYIESTIPPGSTILVQPYSVVLTPTRESLVEALTRNLGSPERASTKFQIQLSLDPYPSPAYRLIWLGSGGLDADKIYIGHDELAQNGLDPLFRLSVAYIVIKRYNRPDPESLAFLTRLEREARRIAAFSPYRPGVSEAEQARVDPFLHNTDTRIEASLERPGPALEIWQLNGAGS